MTYLSINANRLTHLLSAGLHENELRQFFKERRTALVANHAKVQNLSASKAAQVKAIVEKCPKSTDEIIRKWFCIHVTSADLISSEDVLAEYQLYEDEGDVVPKDQQPRLARSCLVNIFSENPESGLLEFLRSVPKSLLKLPIHENNRPDPGPSEQVAGTEISVKLISLDVVSALAAALIAETDISSLADDLPPLINNFVGALLDVREGNLNAARTFAAELPEKSQQKVFIDKAIERVSSQSNSLEKTEGLVTRNLVSFVSDFDADSDAVLGICTNADKPKAVFVHPIAILRGDEAFALVKEQREAAFPVSGDILAWVGSDRPRQPKRGEIGLWRVGRHGDTGGRTQFHLDSEMNVVYEITRVPFPSNDPNSVREFIKESAASQGGLASQPQLFVLSDGLIIAPKTDRIDLSRDESFEGTFRAWRRLEAIKFESRLFFTSRLPSASYAYECAPLAFVVRQLIKASTERAPQLLSNLQRRDLMARLTSSENGLDGRRAARVAAEIETLVLDEDAVSSTSELLMKHPAIEASIGSRLDAVVKERENERAQLRLEIERLKREKDEWAKRVNDERSKAKRVANDASASVKVAFEKAIASGVETLANAEIFAALQPDARKHNTSQPQFQTSAIEVEMSDVPPRSIEEVERQLVGYAMNRIFVAGLIKLFMIAKSSGVALIFRGRFSRAVARALAAIDSKSGAQIRIEVGLVSARTFNALIKQRPFDSLAVIDANLSDMSLYGSDFLLERFSASLIPDEPSRPALVFSLSGSPMALPVAEELKLIGLTIDLDNRADIGNSTEQTLLDDALDETISTSLLAPALYERLIDATASIEGSVRQVVQKLLVNSFNT